MNTITVSKTFSPTKEYAIKIAAGVESDELAEKLIRAANENLLSMKDRIDPIRITDAEAREIVAASPSGDDRSWIGEAISGELREFMALMGELPPIIQRQVIEHLRKGRNRREVVYIKTYGEDLGPEIRRIAGEAREYEVPSATDEDISYKIRVENGKPTCSCVGFTLRKTCHHVNEPDTWTPIN